MKMIGYLVSLKIYSKGYLARREMPMPYINIAFHKNFIALYHLGISADKSLLDWFTTAYDEAGIGKLDIGKSCIRLSTVDKLPFTLIGELVYKRTPDDWLASYKVQVSNRYKR
ncbi:MAG: DUF1801 domain-containing protein [Saprospiraceae bacterium]